jgi:hypothetical protein
LFEDTGIDPEYIQSGLLMMDEYDTLKAQAWIDKYNAFISALTTIICPLIGNILLSLSNKDELQAPPQTIVLLIEALISRWVMHYLPLLLSGLRS